MIIKLLTLSRNELICSEVLLTQEQIKSDYSVPSSQHKWNLLNLI